MSKAKEMRLQLIDNNVAHVKKENVYIKNSKPFSCDKLCVIYDLI